MTADGLLSRVHVVGTGLHRHQPRHRPDPPRRGRDPRGHLADRGGARPRPRRGAPCRGRRTPSRPTSSSSPRPRTSPRTSVAGRAAPLADGGGHRRRVGQGSRSRRPARRAAPTCPGTAGPTRWPAESARVRSSARYDLFDGRAWVLTPTDETAPEAVEAARPVARRGGRGRGHGSSAGEPRRGGRRGLARASDRREPRRGPAGGACRRARRGPGRPGPAGRHPDRRERPPAVDPDPRGQRARGPRRCSRGLADRRSTPSIGGPGDGTDGARRADAPGARAPLARAIAAGNAGHARIPGKHGAAPTAYRPSSCSSRTSPGQLGRLFQRHRRRGREHRGVPPRPRPRPALRARRDRRPPAFAADPGHRAGTARLAAARLTHDRPTDRPGEPRSCRRRSPSPSTARPGSGKSSVVQGRRDAARRRLPRHRRDVPGPHLVVPSGGRRR